MKNNRTPIKLLYAAPAIMKPGGNEDADGPVNEPDAPGAAYPENYTEPETPDTDTPIEDVYNGPEMYEGADGGPEEIDESEEPDRPEKEVPMAPVYAGPEFFEERRRRAEAISKATECVYAGPDYFAGRGSRAPRMGRVYAGPVVDPDDSRNDRRKLMQGVYAVPRIESNDQTPFMAVYAGPEMMSNPGFVGPGVFVPDPGKKPADQGYCPICGGKVSETSRFCETCGAKLERAEDKKPEQPENGAVICPNCGAAVPKGSPFCHECGTPIPKEPAEPEKPGGEKNADGPLFESVYACPPLLKKGGKQPPKKGLFSRLFKKEKK